MPIEDRYYINLKGKQYPVYAGVLIEATRIGLKSLTTDLIQIPDDENGQMAIVRARAEFEDGRIFVDYGDCSPRNCAPMIATAAIRMASTRAKGRVLRDGIGLGETLAEEIPDERAHADLPPAVPVPRAVNQPPPESAGDAGANGGELFCQECGQTVTPGQRAVSLRRFNRTLCPSCQRTAPVNTSIA